MEYVIDCYMGFYHSFLHLNNKDQMLLFIIFRFLVLVSVSCQTLQISISGLVSICPTTSLKQTKVSNINCKSFVTVSGSKLKLSVNVYFTLEGSLCHLKRYGFNYLKNFVLIL